MTVFLVGLGYILAGYIVGRTCHNVILTHQFNKLKGTLDKWDIKYYGKSAEATEEEAILNKIAGLGEPTMYGWLLGGILPVGIVFLLCMGIYKVLLGSTMPNFMLAKPVRELRMSKLEKAQKEDNISSLKNIITESKAYGMDTSELEKLLKQLVKSS